MKTWIILTGQRGCGKTTVGRILSSEIGYSFLDLDELIEQNRGFSIPEIFKIFGEPHFRALEELEIIKLPLQPLVLATGAGIIESPSCMKLLLNRGTVFFLDCNEECLKMRRSKNDNNRPRLMQASSIEEEVSLLFHKRQELYSSLCNHKISNSDSIPRTITQIRRTIGL